MYGVAIDGYSVQHWHWHHLNDILRNEQIVLVMIMSGPKESSSWSCPFGFARSIIGLGCMSLVSLSIMTCRVVSHASGIIRCYLVTLTFWLDRWWEHKWSRMWFSLFNAKEGLIPSQTMTWPGRQTDQCFIVKPSRCFGTAIAVILLPCSWLHDAMVTVCSIYSACWYQMSACHFNTLQDLNMSIGSKTFVKEWVDPIVKHNPICVIAPSCQHKNHPPPLWFKHPVPIPTLVLYLVLLADNILNVLVWLRS